jgi:hypothetical protein
MSDEITIPPYDAREQGRREAKWFFRKRELEQKKERLGAAGLSPEEELELKDLTVLEEMRRERLAAADRSSEPWPEMPSLSIH